MSELKDEDLKPGLADRDPELKAWLDAPEQSYNRFDTDEAAMEYAKKLVGAKEKMKRD